MKMKDLELNDNEFQLLVDGLDSLIYRATIGGMISIIIQEDDGDDENAVKKAEWDRVKKKKEMDMMKEDITILQGKLLSLKRHLKEEDALEETYNIINKTKE